MFRFLKNKCYDSTKIEWDHLLFSSKDLWKLLIPIMIEQLLNSLMGMVDTMMVSNVGSVAVASVSLVDSINTLVIQVFAALATGAAIICSQYLGNVIKIREYEFMSRYVQTNISVLFF